METKLRIINELDKNREGIHIRGLARNVKTSYNNVVRNLKLLEKENIIEKRREANLVKIKLKKNLLTEAYLKLIHTERFMNLPKNISEATREFIDEIKDRPLIAMIFGSYARGDFSKNSDIDVLLVFQKTPKGIEDTARRISMRTNTKINPVYIDYNEFFGNFAKKTHEFSKEIRKNIILLLGSEHYYELLWGIQE